MKSIIENQNKERIVANNFPPWDMVKLENAFTKKTWARFIKSWMNSGAEYIMRYNSKHKRYEIKLTGKDQNPESFYFESIKKDSRKKLDKIFIESNKQAEGIYNWIKKDF